jgi:hypothetical protein
MVDFFLLMKGRFGEFRFEHLPTVYESCRFESDTGPALASDVTLPIRILR